MRRTAGHSAIGRALFAALFLLLSALQPGMFAAANATGFHADGGINPGIEEQLVGQELRGAHDHGHGDEAVSGKSDAQHHYGGKKSAGKSCEVHCAPAHAVPVDCPDIEPTVARCFPPVVADTLPLGEYAVHARPPEHMI